MQHLASCPKTATFRLHSTCILTRVRFLAYHRIKPHAPPLVRAPVNSFEFQPCDRTPQVGHLSLSLSRRLSIADNECPSFTAWTTRVSNPVWSPRFRASASIADSWDAFAIGVLCDIYAFHRYTTHSSHGIRIQVKQYQRHGRGWAPKFHRWLTRPPTHPLNPINPDNARILRITAAAGTELADAYSSGTCKRLLVGDFIPWQKKFTTRRASILHAAWLGQSCLHCPIFLTAASRRSLVRVSVPVWGTVLSDPLAIVDLVGRYPANYLIARMPIQRL